MKKKQAPSKAPVILFFLLIFLGVFFIAVGIYYFLKQPQKPIEDFIPAKNLVFWTHYDEESLPWFVSGFSPLLFSSEQKAIAIYDINSEFIPIFFSLNTHTSPQIEDNKCIEINYHIACSTSEFLYDILHPSSFTSFSQTYSDIDLNQKNLFWADSTLSLSFLTTYFPEKLNTLIPRFSATHSLFLFSFFDAYIPSFFGYFDYKEQNNFFSLQIFFPKSDTTSEYFKAPKSMAFSAQNLPSNSDMFISILSGDEIIRSFFDQAQAFEYIEGVSFKNTLQQKLQHSFLSSLSLEQDIYPLLSGRSVLGISSSQTHFFFSLPSPLLADKKREKIEKIWTQHWKSKVPQILSHTLPDGSVIREVFPRSDIFETQKINQSHYHITQFKNTVNNSDIPPFSIAQKDQEVFLFSGGDQETLPLFNPEKKVSPLFYNLPIQINHPYEIASIAFFPSRFPFFTSFMAYRISASLTDSPDHFSLQIYLEG